MNRTGLPWVDLAPPMAQSYYHLAWFLYGWIEREQLLNLNACAAWWLRVTKR